MIKKLLAITIAAVGLSSATYAADMRMPVKAAPIPVAIFSWTGFYVGVNGGYGWGRSRWDFQPTLLSEGRHDIDGGTIGGQIGYNWQAGNWVFGLEAQGNWSDFRGSNVSLLFPAITNRSGIDAFGLFTGRIGYAFDRFMIYGKGGGAVADIDYRFYNTITGLTGGRADETRWGATAGAGFEWAFDPAWSFGLEYNHLFLGSRDVNFLVNVTDRVRLDVDIITARVNFRFGGPAMTRY